MSNIGVFETDAPYKVEFEKGLKFRVNEFYSYKKDLVFRFCLKDFIFIYYVHEKSLDFGRLIMPGNKFFP